jgi:hypothetical protein
MKRSGSPAGCDTQRVLEVCYRDSELLRHNFEIVACPEALKSISDTSTAMTKDRLAKRSHRISKYLCSAVLRQANQTSITIWSVFYAVQIVFHHFSKDALAMPHHNEFTRAPGLGTITHSLGVVVKDLRTIRVQSARGQRILQSDIMVKTFSAGRIRCKGTPFRRIAARTMLSARPTNGTMGLPRPFLLGNAVTIGSPITLVRPGGVRV